MSDLAQHEESVGVEGASFIQADDIPSEIDILTSSTTTEESSSPVIGAGSNDVKCDDSVESKNSSVDIGSVSAVAMEESAGSEDSPAASQAPAVGVSSEESAGENAENSTTGIPLQFQVELPSSRDESLEAVSSVDELPEDHMISSQEWTSSSPQQQQQQQEQLQISDDHSPEKYQANNDGAVAVDDISILNSIDADAYPYQQSEIPYAAEHDRVEYDPLAANDDDYSYIVAARAAAAASASANHSSTAASSGPRRYRMGDAQIICPACPKVTIFKGFSSTTGHLASKHGWNTIQCNDFQRNAERLLSGDDEYESEADSPIPGIEAELARKEDGYLFIRCPVRTCGELIRGVDSLSVHLTSLHRWPQDQCTIIAGLHNNLRCLECPTGGKTNRKGLPVSTNFNGVFSYTQHMQGKHQWTWTQCAQRVAPKIASAKKYLVSVAVQLESNGIGTGKSAYKRDRPPLSHRCSECSQLVVDLTTLQNHMLVKHAWSFELFYHFNLVFFSGAGNIFCPTCPANRFSSKSALRQHLETKHDWSQRRVDDLFEMSSAKVVTNAGVRHPLPAPVPQQQNNSHNRDHHHSYSHSSHSHNYTAHNSNGDHRDISRDSSTNSRDHSHDNHSHSNSDRSAATGYVPATTGSGSMKRRSDNVDGDLSSSNVVADGYFKRPRGGLVSSSADQQHPPTISTATSDAVTSSSNGHAATGSSSGNGHNSRSSSNGRSRYDHESSRGGGDAADGSRSLSSIRRPSITSDRDTTARRRDSTRDDRSRSDSRNRSRSHSHSYRNEEVVVSSSSSRADLPIRRPSEPSSSSSSSYSSSSYREDRHKRPSSSSSSSTGYSYLEPQRRIQRITTATVAATAGDSSSSSSSFKESSSPAAAAPYAATDTAPIEGGRYDPNFPTHTYDTSLPADAHGVATDTGSGIVPDGYMYSDMDYAQMQMQQQAMAYYQYSAALGFDGFDGNYNTAAGGGVTDLYLNQDQVSQQAYDYDNNNTMIPVVAVDPAAIAAAAAAAAGVNGLTNAMLVSAASAVMADSGVFTADNVYTAAKQQYPDAKFSRGDVGRSLDLAVAAQWLAKTEGGYIVCNTGQ